MPNKVSTGKPKIAGAISRAPLGTPIPKTPTESLNSAFVTLGYITEDGWSLGNNIAKDVIKAWGGDVVIANQTDKGYTADFGLMEHLNSDVHKVAYGDSNVTESDTMIEIKGKGDVGDSSIYVIDMLTKDGKSDRVIIYEGDVTAIGEVSFKDADAIVYPVTLTMIANSNGEYFDEMIEK